MRFASIGGSNAASYAGAGKSVADSAARSFAVQRKSGPDYAELSKTAMKTSANEKITGMQAAAKVTNAGIDAYEGINKTAHKVKVFNKQQEIKANQRKAGGLAAIGKIAGAGFLAATDNTKGRERPKADLGGLYEGWKAKHDALKSKQQSESDALGSPTTPEFKSSAGTPGKVTTGATVQPLGSSLTGDQKTVADAVASAAVVATPTPVLTTAAPAIAAPVATTAPVAATAPVVVPAPVVASTPVATSTLDDDIPDAVIKATLASPEALQALIAPTAAAQISSLPQKDAISYSKSN